MARYGKYRQQLNRRKTTKRRAGKAGLGLYVVLCVFLVGLIFLTRERIGALTKELSRGFTRNVVQTEEATEEPLISMDNVRVVLLGEEERMYRAAVCITGDLGCVVENGQGAVEVTAGQPYVFSGEANARDASCIRISPKDGGKLFLSGEDGAPLSVGYSGILEVWQEQEGYVLVNDVGLEDYLIGVLPSEMPESYGLEALKAQAVCARTYVYTRNVEDGYPRYQARVDDTVSYQVYNRQPPTEAVYQAVAQTAGQVLSCGEEPVNTLYYSTSCGVTQRGDLFGENENIEILQSVYVGNGSCSRDWDAYLRATDENAFEKNVKYFRWQVRLEMGQRQEEVLNKLIAVKQEYPEDVVYSGALDSTLKNNKDKGVKERFGEYRRMEIIRRNEGGAVEELKMEFAYGEVTVRGQLHIRDVLGAGVVSATLGDGSSGGSPQRLYSSAFTWDVGQNGAYVLYGGGYGHGVGMSQNGAKELCALGYTYDAILAFFYQQSSLTTL